MFYFKSILVLCDGHCVPLKGVCWGWEALSVAESHRFAGSLPSAPPVAQQIGTENFHCFVRKNLKQTE